MSKSPIIAKPSQLVQEFLHLSGDRFSIDDYPYLHDIYDTDAPELGLFTGRQVAKCGHINSRCTLEDGSIKKLGEISPGDRVVSVSEGFRSEPRKVTRTWRSGRKECLEIVTKGGAKLIVSKDHKLLSDCGYIKASDLAPGAVLASCHSGGVFHNELPRGGISRVKATAYMIGDGCTGGALGSMWCFTSMCDESLREVQSVSTDHLRYATSSKADIVRFHQGHPICKWMELDGLDRKYSYEKTIPSWVFRLSRKNTALFLSRLWATDGSITIQQKSVMITYASTSEELAYQVMSLLRKLGVRTQIRSFIPTCNGREHREAYQVRVLGMDAVQKFYDEIKHVPGKPFVMTPDPSTERRSTVVTLPPVMAGMLRESYAPIEAVPKRLRKNGIHKYGLKWPRHRISYEKFARWMDCYDELGLPTEEMRSYSEADVWWDTIKSIKPAGEVETVDIEVEGNHNFLLDTGIVSHNSTFLASMLVLNAVLQENGRQVLVSPLQEQAYVFSMQRLKDFTDDSPFVKDAMFTGHGVVNQVLRKVFTNGHMITLGYAQRTADRLRGQSIKDGATLGFDEIQDILPEVIPVVKELGFRAKNVSYMYCGTPKTFSNHMEAFRNRSTANEWAVKCHHPGCGHWNFEWNEENIGDTGVVCSKCKQPINTNTGLWVPRRKRDDHLGIKSRVTMESYRIPQLIVKPIMDDPIKWRELLNKMRDYSTEKFYNEVLGLPFDSAEQPITRDQLLACCVGDRLNQLPDPRRRDLPPLVLGVDWATPAGEDSYTFVVIGGWSSFPHKFEVYYWKCFKGSESNPLFQIDWITQVCQNYNIRLIGADFGVGSVQNISLVNNLGEESLVQLWHTGMTGRGGMGARAKWDPVGRKYHLARTRVLSDTYESLRRTQVSLPSAEYCDEFFSHLLAPSIEYQENSHTIRYVNIDPDDGVHALTFAMLAGELLLRGDFGGHLGSESPKYGAAGMHDHQDIADIDMLGPLDDSYYG